MRHLSIFNISNIYLMLGYACNFHCKHCIENGSVPRIKKRIDERVLRWIDNVVNSKPCDFRLNIMFWGGEPLLYRDMMHQVTDYFGDRVNYSMVSNGALLTDEDVEWINKYDITYVYSNDGKNTCMVRDKNMFEDEVFLERFNRINNKGVDGVFHSMNQDPHEFWEYVRSKSPDCEIIIEGLTCCQGVTKDYVDFDYDKLSESFKKIENDVINGVTSGVANESCKFMLDPIRKIEKRQKFDLGVRCGILRNQCALDVNGNLYICHNSDIKIGTIDDDYTECLKKGYKIVHEILRKNYYEKGCYQCEHVNYCKSHCIFESASELQEKMCRARSMYWNTAKRIIMIYKRKVDENSL